MKKRIIIPLLSVMLVALMGCAGEAKDQEPVEDEQNQEQEVVKDHEEKSESINVDKNLLSVEVTLPAEIAGDLTGFDREVYLKENPEISDVKVLEDGALWMKMSRAKHQELVTEMKESIVLAFNDLIEGEDTPYIRDITTDDAFEEVEVLVDRAGYENTMDFSSLTIMFSVGYLHTLQGNDFVLHLKYIDAETDEVIEEMTLPE